MTENHGRENYNYNNHKNLKHKSLFDLIGDSSRGDPVNNTAGDLLAGPSHDGILGGELVWRFEPLTSRS